MCFALLQLENFLVKRYFTQHFISKLCCESEEFQILPALPQFEQSGLVGTVVTERESF